MPEPNDELETLRRTNGELLTKSATRKQRIIELERANAELQSKLTEATASLKQVTVDRPLMHLAEEMSSAPELFMEQLSKHFKIELVEGKLTLLTPDSKPAVNKDGKSVSLDDRQALREFLTHGDNPRAKAFSMITIASRASGAAVQPKITPKSPKLPAFQFGLGKR